MTSVLLAVAPDVFSAGGIVAGVPFACAHDSASAVTCMSTPPLLTPTQQGDKVRAASAGLAVPTPRVSVWQGFADTVVSPLNLSRLVDQWTNAAGIDNQPDRSVTSAAVRHDSYGGDGGVAQVETWLVTAATHGTPVDSVHGCGTAAPFVVDVGICSSRDLAEFFGLLGGQSGGLDGGVDAGPGGAGGDDAGSSQGPTLDAGGSPGVDAGAVDAGQGAPGPRGCGCVSFDWQTSLALTALVMLLARTRARQRGVQSPS